MDSAKVGVVVCGGRGSRLGPLGRVFNKTLLPFEGRPIVQHAIELMRDIFRCQQVVLLIGHLGDQLQEVVLDLGITDIDISFLRDAESGGTLGAASRIAREHTSFAYSHGNIALGSDARRRLLAALETCPPGASLIAGSGAEFAPTHPHLATQHHHATSVGNRDSDHSVCSVGTGLYLSDHVDLSTRETGRLEDALAPSALASSLVRTVDVGSDWVHLEDLSFYA